MAGEDLYGIGANDLTAFQNSVYQSDPYGMAGNAIGSARFNTSTWSPGATAATAFGQAFLTGLLNRYAQQDAADQTNKLISVLPQLRSDPMSVVAPEGIDAAPFATIKANAIAKNQIAEQNKQNTLSDLIQKLQLAGPMAEAAAKGTKLGELEAYGSVPGSSAIPGSPGYQVGKDTKALENTFYDRITSLPQYKLLSDLDSNIKALPAIALQDNKAADVALFSTIARIRDPNSTVREGEIKINQDTQSYLDSIYGGWRGVVNGESKMTPFDKLRIVNSVVPKFDELKKSYDDARNPLLDSLESQGGKRANIPTTDFKVFQLSPLAQGLAKQEAAKLQAEGTAPAVIAQTLRSKYGEYIK